MTVNEWLRQAQSKLDDSEVATARLDSLVLLEDATGKERSWLLAHPDTNLDDLCERLILSQLNIKVARRAEHEPLSFIRGKSEFYGREFIVSPDTLEPRPETETMVTLLRDIVDSKKLIDNCLADIGTGSGCIAVTVKKLFPEAEVYATDINESALEIAKKNAKNHNADIYFYKGNLLEPLYNLETKTFNLLCNLPYVPTKYELNSAAKHEPKVAIFGGKDGLGLYRQLFGQLASKKLKDKNVSYVLTESLPFQHESLAKIAKSAGYKLIKTDDFVQVFQLIR